ncbi:energy transducer TonB family protein [Sphingomonas oleivorans]|uniref:energy transducer TonB family protein n=1 Tax=Sphingomonas oleivorans TaxID=1735121 RepID=UPI0013FE32B1|nr:TonB family protein [Sphingomonas oleivorans]
MEPDLANWIERVEEDLDRHLSYPRPLGGAPYSEGIVHVSFLGGPDGRPSEVAIRKSSGARDLDAAAMRAVRKITTLHPLPAGVSADQKYEAAILFATQDDRETARKLAELRRRARAEVEVLGLADPAGGGVRVALVPMDQR